MIRFLLQEPLSSTLNFKMAGTTYGHIPKSQVLNKEAIHRKLILSFRLLGNVVAFEFGTKFRFQPVMTKKQQD